MHLLEVLGLAIKRLQHHSHCILNARLAPLGISLVQWNALREIKLHPGLSMHGLAVRTFNSDQAFGTLMTRLLRQKLVVRQPGAGRTNLHRLTPRGETLLEDGHRCIRQTLVKIFAPLSAAEHTQLQTLLHKVLREDPDAPPGAVPTLTHFCETMVGVVPGPGRPAIHAAGGPRTKPSPRPAKSKRPAATSPKPGRAR